MVNIVKTPESTEVLKPKVVKQEPAPVSPNKHRGRPPNSPKELAF